ncbi:MAG: sigma-70 family RNA polymerase sigma factor [Lachnoclostridium sp.]|nr:sigma-70 family RNA polymerase sigma factor [Lachnoclostridium sp.]
MSSQQLTNIFTTMRRRFKTMAASILGNDDDADDALGDAFCRLWVARENMDNVLDMEALTSRVIRNECIDRLRRRNAHPSASIDDYMADAMAETSQADDRDDIYREVTSMIDKHLTPRERDILYSRDRDGAEFADIAAAYQTTEANVRLILSRARKKIRNIYRNE